MKNKFKLSPGKKRGIVGWLLNAPYLIYSLVFFLIPLIWAAWLSVMDWNLMSKNKTFVGLNNFKALFTDARVQAAFVNSFKYLVNASCHNGSGLNPSVLIFSLDILLF